MSPSTLERQDETHYSITKRSDLRKLHFKTGISIKALYGALQIQTMDHLLRIQKENMYIQEDIQIYFLRRSKCMRITRALNILSFVYTYYAEL